MWGVCARRFTECDSKNLREPGLFRGYRSHLRRRPQYESSRRWPTFRLEVTRNQSCAGVKGEIRPCPLKQHGEPIAEPNEIHDVDEQPGDPRRQSAEMNIFQIG